MSEEENKGYTATEIQIIESRAYDRGRADEESRWKDVKDDLTAVYLNGFYDGENKYKDKIKEKIKECEKRRFSDFTLEPNFAVEKVLQELLEEVE